MNFDEILSHIGGFGKFQKSLYVWICLPQILLAFHMLISVFTGAVPPHLCRSTNTTWPLTASSDPPNFNFSLVTGPDGDPGRSCSAPGGIPGTPLAQLNHSTALALSDSHATEGCQGGWEFSKETFHSTVATEVSKRHARKMDVAGRAGSLSVCLGGFKCDEHLLVPHSHMN